MNSPKTTRLVGDRLVELSAPLYRLTYEKLRSGDPGLSYRQYRALVRIEEGYRSVTELSELFGLAMPTVSSSIETLVKKGFVRRDAEAGDRRRIRLSLTEEGRLAVGSSQDQIEVVKELLADSIDELNLSSTEIERFCLAIEHVLTAVRTSRRDMPDGSS
jgi:DNA-binding MarR family transcriptional regulator